MRSSRSLRLAWFYDAVVEQQQQGCENADGGEGPQEKLWLVANFAEVMEQRAADAACEKCADTQRQKCKAHVRALLAGWGEARNVIVVARLLRKFAKRDDDERGVDRCDGGMYGENRESNHGDEGAEDDGAERGHFLCGYTHGNGKSDYDGRTGGQHAFSVGFAVDVIVHVNRQRDEFLPVDNPESRKDQQKQHEFRIAKRFPGIA